jgi:hypothetical protein
MTLANRIALFVGYGIVFALGLVILCLLVMVIIDLLTAAERRYRASRVQHYQNMDHHAIASHLGYAMRSDHPWADSQNNGHAVSADRGER